MVRHDIGEVSDYAQCAIVFTVSHFTVSATDTSVGITVV
ncbi:Uncharacterised protein [Vibrio cholerae]|nr:Uncharacterised protein [Vibrio cholerae]